MNEFFSQLLTYQSNFNHTNCSTNHQCSCTGSEWFHVKIICACWRHFLSKRELLFCWFAELRRRLLKSFFSAKISYISRNLLSKHSARMKVAEITQAKSYFRETIFTLWVWFEVWYSGFDWFTQQTMLLMC